MTNVKEFLTRYTSRLLKKAHLLRWRARALVAAYQEYAWTHLRWVPRASRTAGYPSEGWVVWTFLSSLGDNVLFSILLLGS